MFGKRLANLRKKLKLSQYELAEKLSFSRGQIANYEQGQRQPDYDTLEKIADFFGVSVDYLLGRENTPPTVNAWLRTETTDLTDEEREELAEEIEDYFKARKERILKKRDQQR